MIYSARMTISKGYTLIEILIVVVIISIISSIALVTISHNPHKQLASLTHQLTRLITLNEQEAMLRPAIVGLGFYNHGLQFYDYLPTKNTWLATTHKDLPKQVQITLVTHNQQIRLDGKPSIIISESGDITPFKLTLETQNSHAIYVITGDASGNIQTEMYHEK